MSVLIRGQHTILQRVPAVCLLPRTGWGMLPLLSLIPGMQSGMVVSDQLIRSFHPSSWRWDTCMPGAHRGGGSKAPSAFLSLAPRDPSKTARWRRLEVKQKPPRLIPGSRASSSTAEVHVARPRLTGGEVKAPRG